MIDINVDFDFTTDSKNFWLNFWQDDDLLGCPKSDPDSQSKMLLKFHSLLWKRKLPNGLIFDLKIKNNNLYFKEMKFGCDSIITGFRYKCMKNIFLEYKNLDSNYYKNIEQYIHESYTIGGNIIFPKCFGGINQERGWNRKIRDRWDLTLECIRLFYSGEKSPLYDCLLKNKTFFEYFDDFEGYVKFFLLNDMVSKDFKKVLFWLPHKSFEENPLPNNLKSYLQFMKNELNFLHKRNARIKQFIST